MRRYKLDIRGKEFLIDVDELAANRFAVIVGDETYEVELSSDEDLPEATITPGFAPTRPAAAARPAGSETKPARPARAAPPAAAAAPAKSAASAGTLAAPMPGVVLEVSVKVGDTVARGQQIAILEAMKMQNSIKSPRAGTIAEICVDAGQAVGHGDALIRYREA